MVWKRLKFTKFNNQGKKTESERSSRDLLIFIMTTFLEPRNKQIISKDKNYTCSRVDWLKLYSSIPISSLPEKSRKETPLNNITKTLHYCNNTTIFRGKRWVLWKNPSEQEREPLPQPKYGTRPDSGSNGTSVKGNRSQHYDILRRIVTRGWTCNSWVNTS